MVKKIGGKGPKIGSGTGAVEGSKEVKTSKVGSSQQVQKTAKKAKTSGGSKAGRKMTTADRDTLYTLINEEAEKMFGPDGLPEEQRKTVESAVKMAVDSSLLDESDEENKG